MPIAPDTSGDTQNTATPENSASTLGVILPPVPSADPEVEAGPDFDLKKITKAYVTDVRQELVRQQLAGQAGQTLVSLYTSHIDQLLQYLFDAATNIYARRYTRLKQRCAVLAQGGYGRAELNPYSDIDLLFVYHWKVTPYVEAVCETIYYSLIDAGFIVGQAVRTTRECTRMASQDLQVKTSLIDARPLCGDPQLIEEFTTALEREIIGKQPKRFFQEKAQESYERYERYGNSTYRLEPNIKESPGGLRDLHTAWWLARVKFKVKSWNELLQKGIIHTQTLSQVEEARDFLWRVRNGMHLASQKEHDQLTIEQQELLAPQLGFADAAGLMYAYYQHATTLQTFSQTMIERCQETSRPSFFLRRRRGRDIRAGVRIGDDGLVVTRPEILTDDPTNMVSVFHDAQRHGVRLNRATQELIRDTLQQLSANVGETPQVRDALYTILSWKQRVADTLRSMHSLGVLGWVLPEFGQMLWRIQRDLYHVYTVDEHTLYGIEELEHLRDGTYKTELPLLTQVMREIDKVELLFLSMLYHDVGKGYGSEHDERSAVMVQKAAERWQMPAEDAHEWYVLVQLHLRMSYIAQRRDISDDALIAEFARTVGTQDVLKKLYLLTFADMKAVGPKVWNSWKAGLLDELYLRTLERFETGESAEEDPHARVQRRKASITLALQNEEKALLNQHDLQNQQNQQDLIEAFLSSMPDSYFLSTPQESAPEHFQLINRFRHHKSQQTTGTSSTNGQATDEPYRLAVSHFPEREYSELTIVTHDQPGLFALLTGVLAVNNLNVAGARISTSHDAIALDVFRLSHAERPELVMDDDLWSRVHTRLGAVLRGERTVEDLLQSTRPPAFLDKRDGRIPTEVTVDNIGSPQYTVIDITAPDRTGFLFRVTSALFQLGLTIHLAKITTNVNQVLDVFYVTNSEGTKIANPDLLADELRRRIFDAEGQA